MKAIVDKSRSLLRFYQRAARILGWVLLCGGSVWLLTFILCILAAVDAAGDLPWPGTSKNVIYALSTFVFSFVVPGLLALLIGQFIAYLRETTGKPGCVLRHGPWVLYACGFVLIAQAILNSAGWHPSALRDPDQAGLLFVSPSLVPLLAKVVICIGLGHILSRILPIVDESKTLV